MSEDLDGSMSMDEEAVLLSVDEGEAAKGEDLRKGGGGGGGGGGAEAVADAGLTLLAPHE